MKNGEYIHLRKKEDSTKHCDIFFWVHKLINGFNKNMTKLVRAGRFVCVDESIFVFYSKYVPGWAAAKRKPHPIGNEYQTTA